jgi:hypothetical protein
MGFIEKIIGGDIARAAAAWTSATAIDTALTAAIKGFNTVVVTLRTTSTITAGAIVFEASDDNTNWYPILAKRVTTYFLESGYTLVANDKKSWRVDVTGFTHFRVRLNPAITGSGTLNLGVTAQMMPRQAEKGSQIIITKSSRFTGAQTDTDIIGAIAAGQRVNVVGYSITVNKATTVNVAAKLGFGGSTIPGDGTAVTGVLFDHDGIEPGSGVAQGNGLEPIATGGDGEELRFTCGAPTTGSIIVTVQYYISES